MGNEILLYYLLDPGPSRWLPPPMFLLMKKVGRSVYLCGVVFWAGGRLMLALCETVPPPEICLAAGEVPGVY